MTNRLRLAGWSFIPIAMVFAVIGTAFQEYAGGMEKSPEARSAAGAFLACIGAACFLLTAASQRRGLLEEEGGDVRQKDRPLEFWVKVGGGYLFSALILGVGPFAAIRPWPR